MWTPISCTILSKCTLQHNSPKLIVNSSPHSYIPSGITYALHSEHIVILISVAQMSDSSSDPANVSQRRCVVYQIKCRERTNFPTNCDRQSREKASTHGTQSFNVHHTREYTKYQDEYFSSFKTLISPFFLPGQSRCPFCYGEWCTKRANVLLLLLAIAILQRHQNAFVHEQRRTMPEMVKLSAFTAIYLT